MINEFLPRKCPSSMELNIKNLFYHTLVINLSVISKIVLSTIRLFSKILLSQDYCFFFNLRDILPLTFYRFFSPTSCYEYKFKLSKYFLFVLFLSHFSNFFLNDFFFFLRNLLRRTVKFSCIIN